MPAPGVGLTALREIVGAAPTEDLLAAAWRRAGGDLARAVQLVLDRPASLAAAAGPRAEAAAGPPSARAGVVELLQRADASRAGATILLDDSDAEGAAAAPGHEVQQLRQPAPALRREEAAPAATAQQAPPADPGRQPSSPSRAPRAPKRPRLIAPFRESVPLPLGCAGLVESGIAALEWAFHLGSVCVDAFSTRRLDPRQLQRGARLDLRWSLEPPKKAKGRPWEAAGSALPGAAGGLLRFDCGGVEVGRFPAGTARMLVPLLAASVIELEALVGGDPPDDVELGTTVQVVLHVSLRSGALSLPGSVMLTSAAARHRRGEGQKAAQSDEASQEVRRQALAQLLERLGLPCLRRSADADVGAGETAAARASAAGPATSDTGHAQESVAAADGDLEDTGGSDGEEASAMTAEAAAQLGGERLLERHELQAVRPPSQGEGAFASALRRYQAQAVFWMWQRENPDARMPMELLEPPPTQQAVDPSGPACAQVEVAATLAPAPTPAAEGEPLARSAQEGGRPLHPMWDEYELPESTGPLPGRSATKLIYHHRTTGALSLDFPDAALAHCRGGVLADDMGLGKTVMCLALLALDGAPGVPSARTAAPQLRALGDAARRSGAARPQQASLFKSGADDAVGGTLVVAPLSLVRQWMSEAEKHYPPGRCPKMHEYHGSGRHLSPESLRSFGLVLTTYGTLAAEREDSPLLQVYWRRVILDEAHSIKNRCSRQAQAAFRLQAFSRWAVTGTPLQNSVEELYSLVRFLRLDPWSAWSAWRRAVALPLERARQGEEGAMARALDAARRIVQPLVIRRTKATVDPCTGQPLLQLPPKHVHVREIDLSPAERDFYEALYKKAKTQFDTFVESGQALAKYTHILQLILKLRQALCHPFLVFARAEVKDPDLHTIERRCLQEMMACGEGISEKFVKQALQDLRSGEEFECPVCCEAPEDATMTPCGHVYCRECAHKIVAQCGGECPVCRHPGVTLKSLKVLPGASRFPSRLLARGDSRPDIAHSTKMKELLELLRADVAEGRRAVVFSQWTSFLDLIGRALESEKVPWQRFDGSLSIEDRRRRVAWLSEPRVPDESGRALLVSLKAGGQGLNLVAATRLYLLDLWWNPAVEEQAIQRVHRIGQTSEVHVYKFVVRDSIDNDLLDLHRAKERLLEDAIHGRPVQQAATKLTLDDLRRLFGPCRSSLRR